MVGSRIRKATAYFSLASFVIFLKIISCACHHLFLKITKKRKHFKISGGSDNKASAYNAGDPGSIPGSGRCPGDGNGNPLQYCCLEKPMDRGVW